MDLTVFDDQLQDVLELSRSVVVGGVDGNVAEVTCSSTLDLITGKELGEAC